jgi:Na+-translocating ferredoxin:NAD+ oxidoreductase subunit G
MSDKKKLPSTFPNMVVVLSVVSLVSALALAFTYTATQEARQQAKVKKTLAALEKVLPPFNNQPNDEKYNSPEDKLTEFYPAKQDGQLVGTAVKTYTDSGFGDRIWLMVGFDTDKKIINISVLEQKETPGLGTKMEESKFKDQFQQKDPAAFNLKVKKDGGDVDAIAAATISSRAFCEAVARAYKSLEKGGEQ